MSNPWLPPYLGSWDELMAALLHNPFLGSERGSSPVTHHSPDDSAAGMTRRGPGAEPNPSPWRYAVRSVVAVISLREVTAKMADGTAKAELSKAIDSAIAQFIDDCGTKYPGWPWPGPPPWVYPIASELALVASSITQEKVRVEVLEVAGKVIERASGGSAKRQVTPPSPEDIDAMGAVFSSSDHECEALCQDLLDTSAALESATGELRTRLTARMGAINRRRRELHCKLCLPQ